MNRPSNWWEGWVKRGLFQLHLCASVNRVWCCSKAGIQAGGPARHSGHQAQLAEQTTTELPQESAGAALQWGWAEPEAPSSRELQAAGTLPGPSL